MELQAHNVTLSDYTVAVAAVYPYQGWLIHRPLKEGFTVHPRLGRVCAHTSRGWDLSDPGTGLSFERTLDTLAEAKALADLMGEIGYTALVATHGVAAPLQPGYLDMLSQINESLS